MGARCKSGIVQCHSRRCARSTGVRGVYCVAVRRRYLRGALRARLACPGSTRLMAGPVAACLTPIVGVPGEVRQSQGCRVVSPSAGGRRGARATCVWQCVVAYRSQCPSGSQRVLRSVWCPSTAGDRSQWAGHACAVLGGARRTRWCRLACSWGLVSGLGSRGLGPWRVPHTQHEGAAEGTEDLVHKGCMCCLGFCLSADGGLRLPAHRQRPDLLESKNGA